MRWLFLFKYPEGVSKEDGERWYLGAHTQEAKKMVANGLVSYKTWKAVPSPYETSGRLNLNEWDRVTELGFEDFESFRRATENGGPFTPPPYGPHGFIAHTIFLHEEEEFDLLNEIPDVP